MNHTISLYGNHTNTSKITLITLCWANSTTIDGNGAFIQHWPMSLKRLCVVFLAPTQLRHIDTQHMEYKVLEFNMWLHGISPPLSTSKTLSTSPHYPYRHDVYSLHSSLFHKSDIKFWYVQKSSVANYLLQSIRLVNMCALIMVTRSIVVYIVMWAPWLLLSNITAPLFRSEKCLYVSPDNDIHMIQHGKVCTKDASSYQTLLCYS